LRTKRGLLFASYLNYLSLEVLNALQVNFFAGIGIQFDQFLGAQVVAYLL
jgi:hypothetical protein